ncbi:MAG: DUF4178 domain-containing protein [Moorea sp. SIO2B7]|nr:DUF4178 domain-containing protein [Moorena sp. SIO2B7]
MWLVWLIIVAVVAIVTYLFIQQQQSRLGGNNSQRLPPLERTIFTLEIGDIVQYLEQDWFVEGKLTYNDDGYIWIEYLLQDGNNLNWLSVDEDDTIEVALLKPTTELNVDTNPPSEIEFQGSVYRLVGSGKAAMTHSGKALNRGAQNCHYYDYKANNDQVMSIEVWNQEIEVSVGNRINPRMLRLLPGDGKKIY